MEGENAISLIISSQPLYFHIGGFAERVGVVDSSSRKTVNHIIDRRRAGLFLSVCLA